MEEFIAQANALARRMNELNGSMPLGEWHPDNAALDLEFALLCRKLDNLDPSGAWHDRVLCPEG